MICTTIQNRTLEEIMNLLESSEPRIQMAEIGLDRCPLSIEEIEYLFSSSDTPLVATCRVVDDGNGTWEEAEEKLTAAVEAGAAFWIWRSKLRKRSAKGSGGLALNMAPR